jgi:hypothetical protein
MAYFYFCDQILIVMMPNTLENPQCNNSHVVALAAKVWSTFADEIS